MPLVTKLFVWSLAIILTLAAAVAIMFAIEISCQIGTDRLDEIANCWSNLKWGTR
jgi:hypothetical protein